MKIFLQSIFVLALSWTLAGAARAIDVTITSSSGENFLTGTPVTFTAAATNTNSVTTYTWDFDDDSPKVVTTDPFVMHTFTAEDVYFITVTVKNGIDADGVDFLLAEAVDPPKPDDPVTANSLDPKKTNPDTGDFFNIDQTQAGFISGDLGVDNGGTAQRDVNEFTTDFGDGVDGRNGSTLLHRYLTPGIFILDSVRTTNGSDAGEVRKTLAFSESEILGQNSDPNVVEPTLTNRQLKFKKFKAKFHFGDSGGSQTRAKTVKVANDTVLISWNMILPGGFDVTTQTVDLAIGNVLESVMLDSHGKGIMLDPTSPLKSVRFKFPHLKKGQTVAPAGLNSLVSVSMSSVDLSTQGFDTEGITPRAHQTTGSKGPFDRDIQVATNFSGVTYTGSAKVSLLVSSDNEFGTVAGRSTTTP